MIELRPKSEATSTPTGIGFKFGGNVTAEDFEGAMKAMSGLRAPVDGFFDEVTVNCEDGDVRGNRLLLLSQIRTTMGMAADFAQIEG